MPKALLNKLPFLHGFILSASFICVLAFTAYFNFIEPTLPVLEISFQEPLNSPVPGGLLVIKQRYVKHRDCVRKDVETFMTDGKGHLWETENVGMLNHGGFAPVTDKPQSVTFSMRVPDSVEPGPATRWSVLTYRCNNPFGALHRVHTQPMPFRVTGDTQPVRDLKKQLEQQGYLWTTDSG